MATKQRKAGGFTLLLSFSPASFASHEQAGPASSLPLLLRQTPGAVSLPFYRSDPVLS
jgi:hypothetical protein